MITCHLRYVLDPWKVAEFEHYARLWISIVRRMGGMHHGYLLPSESANNVALAMFSFTSLAEYETYRTNSLTDEACVAAIAYAERTRCFTSCDRTFYRPVFEGAE